MTNRRLVNPTLPIHVLAVGDFGRVVGQVLKDRFGSVKVTQVYPDDEWCWPGPAVWPTAQAHIMASERNYVAVQEEIAELAAKWRTPFIEAILEGPNLRVGPMVIPNHGACYRCFRARFSRHSIDKDRPNGDKNDNSDVQPVGFSRLFAATAAHQLAEQLIRMSLEPEKIGGTVLMLELRNRAICSERVLPVHGCADCGLKRDERTRSFLSLQADLRYLFGQAADDGRNSGLKSNHSYEIAEEALSAAG